MTLSISGGGGGSTSFPLLASDGAVGAPAYSFSGATNMGVWRNGANLEFSVGGAEVFRMAGGLIFSVPTSFYIGAGATQSVERAAAGVLRIAGTGANAGGLSSVANSPAAIAGNTNDYASGVGLWQRWSATAPFNVTGMVAGVDGEIRFVTNVGANTITLTNQDALSAAANRFITTTGAALALAANGVSICQYDATTQRWRASLL